MSSSSITSTKAIENDHFLECINLENDINIDILDINKLYKELNFILFNEIELLNINNIELERRKNMLKKLDNILIKHTKQREIINSFYPLFSNKAASSNNAENKNDILTTPVKSSPNPIFSSVSSSLSFKSETKIIAPSIFSLSTIDEIITGTISAKSSISDVTSSNNSFTKGKSPKNRKSLNGRFGSPSPKNSGFSPTGRKKSSIFSKIERVGDAIFDSFLGISIQIPQEMLDEEKQYVEKQKEELVTDPKLKLSEIAAQTHYIKENFKSMWRVSKPPKHPSKSNLFDWKQWMLRCFGEDHYDAIETIGKEIETLCGNKDIYNWELDLVQKCNFLDV